MNKVLAAILILSISGYISGVSAYTHYYQWDTCKQEVIEFSHWYQDTDYSNYPFVADLLNCRKDSITYDELLECAETAISNINTTEIATVENYFQSCIVREFLFFESHEPNYAKCYKTSQKCMNCLVDDKSCDTFKLYSTEANKAYEKARQIENCQELKSCDSSKIGFYASGYCYQYTQDKCGYEYVLKNYPHDKCIGMELCDPLRNQGLDFEAYVL